MTSRDIPSLVHKMLLRMAHGNQGHYHILDAAIDRTRPHVRALSSQVMLNVDSDAPAVAVFRFRSGYYVVHIRCVPSRMSTLV